MPCTRRVLHRGLLLLALFFALAQSAAPLLHVHVEDDGASDSGVHIHLGVSVPPAGQHLASSELRDFEARILSAPAAHFRDEALRVLDLPALVGDDSDTRVARSTSSAAQFVAIPASAPYPFPKPLPLAPPAAL